MRSTDPHARDTAASGIAAFQHAFAAALMQPEGELPAIVSARSEAQRVKRFNVYRNNLHASLAAALAARFPVVERLVGTEFFTAMALVFIRQHPPRSPVLAEYGEDLPAFLEQFEPAASLPYLPDVARLEWSRNRAYHAADADPVAITALAAVAPEQLAEVELVLHPSTQLISSPYPIVSIWATNTHDADVRPIGPKTGGECALVTRLGLDVLVTSVPFPASVFIDALVLGRALGDAAAAASAAACNFDLAATLAGLFGTGGVTGLVLPANTQP